MDQSEEQFQNLIANLAPRVDKAVSQQNSVPPLGLLLFDGGAGGAATGRIAKEFIGDSIRDSVAGKVAEESVGAAIGEGVAAGVSTGANAITEAASDGRWYPNASEHPLPQRSPPNLDFANQ